MSRTRKDSRGHFNTTIEIIKVGEDAYDLLLNHEVFRIDAPESALPDWLCVRYGFCGEEYEDILREIKLNGKKVIVL